MKNNEEQNLNGESLNKINQRLDEFYEKFPQLDTNSMDQFGPSTQNIGSKNISLTGNQTKVWIDINNLTKTEDKCWVNTYTGKKFFPLNPKLEDIVLEDIAHSLAMLVRFNGHIKEFYSIAQHSVLVSYFCHPENALHGLMHDAAEYILNDIFSPLKKSQEYSEYRRLEKQLQNLIYEKFNLKPEEPKDVKKADMLVLGMEARDLLPNRHPEWNMPFDNLPPVKIIALNHQAAKELFLKRFEELTLKDI